MFFAAIIAKVYNFTFNGAYGYHANFLENAKIVNAEMKKNYCCQNKISRKTSYVFSRNYESVVFYLIVDR
jgi:hypothetical protein